MSRMHERILLLVLLAFWPGAVLAYKCPEFTPADLRVAFERIALVEVVALGPEFDGQSPIPNVPGRNRYVHVRVVEPLKGEWAPEETVAETLRLGASEFDCSLYRGVGDKLILLLAAKQSLVDLCNARGLDPALLKALRGERKGA